MMALLDHKADAYAVYPGASHRPVLHAILEDGAYAQPFFDSDSDSDTSFRLDLEYRDHQGKTLLHAACRSPLGADAATHGVLDDVDWDTARGFMMDDPFERVSEAMPSLFDALRYRGADVNARENGGKSVLHHLLEATDLYLRRVPIIHRSIKYLLAHHPELVNQPDHTGIYPLHTAFERLRRYAEPNAFVHMAQPEADIDDLLAAKADPRVLDGNGNTMLHYLATTRLADQNNTKDQLRWFRNFRAHGVDVNVRNQTGQSAMEVLLADTKATEERDARHYHGIRWEGYRSREEVDSEIFGLFEQAGIDWTERDPTGQTLLHIIAKQDVKCGPARVKFLISKGVDPMALDSTGITAIDVLVADLEVREEERHPEQRQEVLKVLKEQSNKRQTR